VGNVAEFNTLIKTDLWFICTGNTTLGFDNITMSGIYVHKLAEFMFRLNGNRAAAEEVAVHDTVADLYRTTIQHVQSVMVLVEHLCEVITEEEKMYAIIQNMSLQIKAGNSFKEYLYCVNIHREIQGSYQRNKVHFQKSWKHVGTYRRNHFYECRNIQ
jgi:hypothetical protein